MGKFKDFKTAIRKKIGWVGVGEFVDDPIQTNSKNNWNNWFSDSKFLAEYADPKRLDTLKKMTNILRDNNVFESVQSCMDCGCGTGHLLLEINKQYPDIKLTGTDFSEESIKVSQQIVPNATFFVADVYKEQPEIAEKFDLVICSEVLEHLLYPEKALQNILKAASQKAKSCWLFLMDELIVIRDISIFGVRKVGRSLLKRTLIQQLFLYVSSCLTMEEIT